MDQRDVEMTKHLAKVVREDDPTSPISNGRNDPDGVRASGCCGGIRCYGR